MNSKISVIIPVYQEESGILRRAIRSVCAQAGVSDVEVIVVDDGSRVPASEDVRGLTIPSHISLRILEQNNAGPGAARNKGLDGVGNDTRYVAFLDSDDEWTPDHLCRAVATLRRGYDFYFSNYFETGQQISAIERNKQIDIWSHPRITGLHDIHEYCGDFFSQQFMRPVTCTSTVVYRYTNFRGLRFSEKLIYACEDKFCWLQIAATKPRIAFSSRPECRAGRGANIYYGTKWGTAKALKVLYCNALYNKEVEKEYNLDDKLKAFNRRQLKGVRQNFVSSLLHVVMEGKKLDLRFVFYFFVKDPTSIFVLFLVASRIIARKIRSRNT